MAFPASTATAETARRRVSHDHHASKVVHTGSKIGSQQAGRWHRHRTRGCCQPTTRCGVEISAKIGHRHSSPIAPPGRRRLNTDVLSKKESRASAASPVETIAVLLTRRAPLVPQPSTRWDNPRNGSGLLSPEGFEIRPRSARSAVNKARPPIAPVRHSERHRPLDQNHTTHTQSARMPTCSTGTDPDRTRR